MIGSITVALAAIMTLPGASLGTPTAVEDLSALYSPVGGDWTEMKPSLRPPQASGHTMAYDSKSDRVILYGGWNNQTWSYDYDHDAWTKSSATGPPFLHYCAMTYDSQSDRGVYTGSKTYDGGPMMETWAFDLESDSWKNVTPPASPTARTHHMMAYDSDADRVIMFGGEEIGSGGLDETWEYDYESNNWTKLATTNAPPRRGSGALAYDSGSKVTLLFGGGDNYRDTWAFHYANKSWERKSPPVAGTPLGRIYHAMAYDVRSDRTLLFGGYIIGGGGARDETHIYDLKNDTWAEILATPHPKYSQMTAMAYDSQSDRTIQFGGSGHGDNNDTWAFDDPYEGPPQVLSTFPVDGAAGVPVTSNVEARFSTAMATASVEAAVSSTPAAGGKYAWTAGDSSFTFDPSTDLAPSTKYTFTVSPSARSQGGTAMAAAHTFSFTTEDRPPPAPHVLSSDPADGDKGVPVGASVTITFDQEMDRPATESSVTLSPGVGVSVAWGALGVSVTLDPSSDLSFSTTHTVTVSTGARSKAGAALASPHAFSFSTEEAPDTSPPVISHSPPEAVDGGSPIEIVATVKDDRAVASVLLHYAPGGTSAFTALPMSLVSGDRYRAVIPGGSVKPDSVDFYIEASDPAGNRATSPSSAPNEIHSVQVKARTAPPAPKPDWTLLLLALILVLATVVAAAVVAAARKRRQRCRGCGESHDPRASCGAYGGGVFQ